jgi:small subunit ribosomal protein S4e
MYQKRNNVPKFWPVARKGTKYLAIADHNQNESIPLVIVVRDLLKLVKNKKELKRLLNEKQIQINHREIRETNFPVCLFDILSFPQMKKHYRMILSKGKKAVLEEVSEKKAETKIFKVMDKKMLSKNAVQFNLTNGRNIIS